LFSLPYQKSSLIRAEIFRLLSELYIHLLLSFVTLTMFIRGDSIKALHRERGMLSKMMNKRFSEEERNRLYKKWGIGLSSKRRRLQLANRIWSNTKDIDHVMESAAVVAKLVRFVEQGQALKEMFGLSFTPPTSSTKRRSLGWTYSKSSLL